ncbi:MAG: hypothetical protein P4L56_14430 [Candidatus Sulfopaludibacter sp.]|nr:hypothetical protein [Candidatus Sulfopaludibacter sp.]
MSAVLRGFGLIFVFILTLVAQQPPADSGASSSAVNDKRILGIIPNYRTYPTLLEYKPISAKEKFGIATEDAFDRGTFVLAAEFAGYSQLTKASPSFGQGVEGYSHYFVTSFADWSIGDYMTEAVFPVMLHQDPRYFRRGTGSGPSRLLYAVGQLFWTRTDSGGHMFNFSEIGGNAAAAAISQAYYPENRTAGDAITKLGIQVGMDAASNILKEFWPDLHRKLSRKHAEPSDPGVSPQGVSH